MGSDYRCTIWATEVNCKCTGFTFTCSCVQHSAHNSEQTATRTLLELIPWFNTRLFQYTMKAYFSKMQDCIQVCCKLYDDIL
jgi:hypothetical protein